VPLNLGGLRPVHFLDPLKADPFGPLERIKNTLASL
jgi:hypothetical protein